MIAYDDINVALLQKKHLSYLSNQNDKSKTFIDSYFRVGSNNNIELQLSRLSKGILINSVMTDHWKNSRLILHQSVQIANTDSIAEEFWRQLTILDIIKEDIVTFSESGNQSDLIYQVGANR